MTPAVMFRLHCTALGFLAVVMKDDLTDNQSLRAQNMARLIESFCRVTVPEAFGVTGDSAYPNDPSAIDTAIDAFKAELLAKGDARLPEDRVTLLQFYDRLHQRLIRRKERHFYACGSDDMIANRVLSMVDEEIKQDEGDEDLY